MDRRTVSDKAEAGRRGREKYYLAAFVIMTCLCAYFAYRAFGAKGGLQNTAQIEAKAETKEITHKEKDIYTKEYQDEAQKQIDELKEEADYTVDDPLLISNPYGTNTTSVYYFANSDHYSYAKCTVEADGAEKITQTLKNDGENNLTLQHEYQITGLAEGVKNKITMIFYDRNDKVVDRTYFYVTTDEDSEIPEITKVEEGSSKQEMTDGLFAMLGHDKSEAANVYFYDNEGVSRGKIPLNGYRTDRLITVDGNLIFSYDTSNIAVMNRLGKIVDTIDIGKYEFHHDFCYDEDAGVLLCLVNNTEKDTIEDVLISVDLETGKVKEFIDFEELLPEMRENAVQREGGKNTYGGTELDWLHLNSLDIIDDGEIIVSSREQSALIKVSDIFDQPEISYIIHGGTLYDGTDYEQYLLEQDGDFRGQAGQHTITVEKSDDLEDGQYYLYMFDNNFGNAATIPDFDWDQYPGVGTYDEGDASRYYKYLVDEEEGTYQLVQDFDLPYSSIVSSVQQLGGNIPFSSGRSKCFGEYDEDGNMIKTFTYDADKYSYRVMKYNFKGFYYQ